MIDKRRKDFIRSIIISDYIFTKQGIYTDCSALNSPQLGVQSRLFGSDENTSQTYLRNFENSYKMGPILGTGDFLSKMSNLITLFDPSFEENLDDTVNLPKPRKIKVPLDTVLMNRKSSRFFNGKKISLQNLSDLLFYSAGSISHQKEQLGEFTVNRHKYSYPSGGGMYAITLFVIAYHVEGVEPAIYKYQPVSHTLCYHSKIQTLDSFIITERFSLSDSAYKTIDNLDPSVLFIFENNFKKQRLKYSELSLLLALTDCGGLLQNCGLLAAALNLPFCIWGGFKKAEAEKVLEIDGLDKHIIMSALLGGMNE